MRALRTAALMLGVALLPAFMACRDDAPVASAPNGTTSPAPEAADGGPLVSPASPIQDASVIESNPTGPVGSAEQPECRIDSDCIDDMSHGPSGSVELVSAQCSFKAGEYEQPTCECSMRHTPEAASDAGAPDSHVYPAYPGNRRDYCSEVSRDGSCLYCANEFPGCDIADPNSCDAVCADMAARQNRDEQKAYQVSTRLARCVEAHTRVCRVVTEIDGKCYAGRFGSWLPAALDCQLPDEELLARIGDPAPPPCAKRPAIRCERAEDCPRGLGCADGACTICGRLCQDDINGGIACEGGGTCAGGETCVGFTCVPDANLTCKSFIDCGPDEECLVTGISSSTRGNENTHSFCKLTEQWPSR